MSKATEDGWNLRGAEPPHALLKRTPAQRLAWLEEAKLISEAAKRSR